MDNEIIARLLSAAMIERAEGIEDSFSKMSVNIDRVLRSDFASSDEGDDMLSQRPMIISLGEDGDVLRGDKAENGPGDRLILESGRCDEPYITVPRVV